MNYRDFLQKIIYWVINPLVKGMIRVGITPNFVTTSGFVLNVAAAVLLLYGALNHPRELSYLGWAGGVILFAGLFDMMDGRIARLGGMSSTFGALYDSVLDRYSELVTLFGISVWFSSCGYVWGCIITYIALIGSIMVSYVRARAEGLDIECKVGLMQRPERVVLTALGLILTGLCAKTASFDPVLLTIVPMGLIAVLANLTAFWRSIHCYRQLRKK